MFTDNQPFAQELSLQGVKVSSGGVRGVWSRHKLLTKQERLLGLEKTTCERQIELNPEFRERHIHTRHTGDPVVAETFFVGHLKGVGKVYLQTAINCHSHCARGRLYPNKLPVTVHNPEHPTTTFRTNTAPKPVGQNSIETSWVHLLTAVFRT